MMFPWPEPKKDSSSSEGIVTSILHRYNPTSFTTPLFHALRWAKNRANSLVGSNTDYTDTSHQLHKAQPRIGVFFVHGTWDHTSAFEQLMPRLKESLSSNFCMHVPSFDKRMEEDTNIAEFAAQLDSEVRASGHEQVILIGHSRGGLVISELAQLLARQQDEAKAQPAPYKVLQLHLIGTPFNGSSHADLLTYLMNGVNKVSFGFLRASKAVPESGTIEQMRKGSSYLQQLSKTLIELTEKQQLQAVFHVAMRDSIVSSEDCVPSSPGREVSTEAHEGFQVHRYAYHGHLSILSSNVMARQIVRDCAKFVPMDAARNASSTTNGCLTRFSL